MFSRAAKSVVNSLGSRRIHISEKNFKIALIDGAGEISQTLSQLLKNSPKLNALALYNVTVVNRPLPNYNFYDEQPFKPIPSRMTKKSYKGSRSNAAISIQQTDNNNHEENNRKSQIEKLMDALYRLPIAEKVPAFNSPLIPIEEIIRKPQSKQENLTVRHRESGIGERRERSSSLMKSTVEIMENGKPIESNQIQTNNGSLSIVNSRQQFRGINFVEDFQQDPNSATVHKDCSDLSFLHKHFVTDLRYCGDREFEESKSYDKQGDYNDDYFPQGEEYEDEIGTGDHQLNKKIPSKKPAPRFEDEHDNFEPTMLMLENNRYINGDPLTRFIMRVHFSNIEGPIEADRTMLMSKKVSSQDTIEKLQTLIEKVTEFKRRVFQPKHNAPKTGATTDGKGERKIVNENENNESTNRSSFISQRISTSALLS